MFRRSPLEIQARACLLEPGLFRNGSAPQVFLPAGIAVLSFRASARATTEAVLVPDETKIQIPVRLAGFGHFFHLLPGRALGLVLGPIPYPFPLFQENLGL